MAWAMRATAAHRPSRDASSTASTQGAGDGKGAFRNLQSDYLSRKRGTQGRQIVVARRIGRGGLRAFQLSFEAQGVAHRLAGLGGASGERLEGCFGSGFVGLGFVQLLLSNEAGFHQRLKALARVLGVP